jgi:hypothetical protein
MSFKCPVDYDINNCSSKEYGLTCDTCFHSEDEEYDNFKKQWDEWHKNYPSCTFVLPVEKPMDYVSETMALENWWWELCKKGSLTQKEYKKMKAIEKVINRLSDRCWEHKSR